MFSAAEARQMMPQSVYTDAMSSIAEAVEFAAGEGRTEVEVSIPLAWRNQIKENLRALGYEVFVNFDFSIRSSEQKVFLSW